MTMLMVKRGVATVKLGAVSFSFDAEAQYSHFVTAMLGVLGPIALFHCRWEWGAIGVAVFATFKEFWFDRYHETPEVSGGPKGDRKDFEFYLGGIAAALLLILITGRLNSQ